MQKQKCEFFNQVDQAIAELEGQALPSEYELTGTFLETIAHIRHTYTNYEGLLEKYLPFDGCRNCDPNEIEAFGECQSKVQAHDLLKQEAKALAIQLYKEWNP